jgi:hypothetical protein
MFLEIICCRAKLVVDRNGRKVSLAVAIDGFL